MSAPTPAVRAVVYERDLERCVCCGSRRELTFQHRQATGMGGSKIRPMYVDGVTACLTCNVAFEGVLQSEALRCGWKVARWVSDPSLVPIWDTLARGWYVLTSVGSRRLLGAAEALDMMHSVYGDAYFGYGEE